VSSSQPRSTTTWTTRLIEAGMHISDRFGRGYDKEHPELVGALIIAGAIDRLTAALAGIYKDKETP
jgi:hypothetical protein